MGKVFGGRPSVAIGGQAIGCYGSTRAERRTTRWKVTMEGNDRPHARFADGTPAAAQRYADLVLWLECERAYPPGQPLELHICLDGAEVPLSGRCIGSRRTAEGRYEVRMRLTNLLRTVREGLVEKVGAFGR